MRPCLAGRDRPLSRFPLRGKAGAGGFPPRRWHAAPAKNAVTHRCRGSPHKRGCRPPLCIPPLASSVAVDFVTQSGHFIC